MNRKLIRPDMGEIKEKMGKSSRFHSTDSTPDNPNTATSPQGSSSSRRKIAPPEQTNAESFYYLKQMQAKTPMVIVLQDGEKIRGSIEWYDKHCLKINRVREPNILLPKHNIKYLYKQEEEPRNRKVRSEKKEDEFAETFDSNSSLYD